MTSGSNIDKHPHSNKPLRGNSDAEQLFRPVSPFAPSEGSDGEQLPDWARPLGDQQQLQESSRYNFDWLSNPDVERSTSSETPTHPEHMQSLMPQSEPDHKRQQASSETSRSDFSNRAEVEPASAEKDAKTFPAKVNPISASTPDQTLKTARALSQDGKFQAALGHYLYLVKSDQKLKEVVVDLEAHLANPHISQTPLMLQTLADAYTKSGNLAKALPLYRKALGR
ncbi:MAG: hypothetical protein QF660_03860 [Anaerolineales bacterium]|jgi:hypothetical protein|nr:hypothetical protein [Anaerolineales bacterium]